MSTPPPEDDNTRMVPGSLRNRAAASGDRGDDGNALRPGTMLGEFEIFNVVGVGGFGIVYLAYDHSLDRDIALKEYMPSSFAARSTTGGVEVKSVHHAELFQAGMRSFINEARLLARFDHPSLVKVYRFWEGNGTAYMVMPFYKGLTLKQSLQERNTPPDEAWLRSFLAPLLDALDMLHSERCFHRDIAPDNILMLPDGRPLLLDFGAARRAIGNMAQAFTVILKPGYAPIEQYANAGSMRQGPWTDIYALASVVHFAIIGKPPAASVARMISDPQVALAKSVAARYTDSFLQAIDHALAVKPEDRPQSIAELRSLLGMPTPTLQFESHTSHGPANPAQADDDRTRIALPPAGKAAGPYLPVAVLLVLMAAGGVFLTARHKASTPAAPASQGVMPFPGVGQDKDKAAAPPVAENARPARPLDPLDALDRLFQARNRDHAVSVALENSRVRIGKDRLKFSLRSSKPGYVYILMVGSDRSQFWLLFPNDIDRNNAIAAAKPLNLPRSGWLMDAAGPPGIDYFLAIVSESPRDFSEAGLRPHSPFAEFSLAGVTGGERERDGAKPKFAGKPDCPATRQTPCPDSYGAALFSIEEILPR
jgi:serine/threonine protein kinase